MLYINRTSN